LVIATRWVFDTDTAVGMRRIGCVVFIDRSVSVSRCRTGARLIGYASYTFLR
jgi:hypothetical protein